MTFTTKRTTSSDPDFIVLVKLLDAELAKIDGEEHGFYAQYNKIDKINHVVLVYDNDIPVACGAIKAYATDTMEVKRMFTQPNYRGRGAASLLLQHLEIWAHELGFDKCVLETGKRQPDAISLYQKNSYHIIPNYGQYEGIDNSICFEKILVKQ
ncbi:GNAT family N-acetyltransferase [Pedobacter chitinilyticus]|uniref:GNAT family N-acetyltransferase n=1 Tax=Pedobacter chitinilyticus TaxID=2233776 RepID=A0A443YPD4_9SPHI|nr:GNAT family N-acetyltransferase [Pedobacter chitinilyticus]RWU05618.1 GNAT family N-acetyltransferase [Pedobacter chitinilyticus]